VRRAQRAAQSGEAGDGGERRTAAEARSAQVPGVPGVPRPDLKPSREMLDKAIGRGPGSMDYLKDVDEGDFTGLNAKKHRFASFFNRLKRQVGQEWHPDVVYLRHDPNGNVYGVKDRITVLTVVLSADGHYESSSLMQSCGVGFLDDEAQVAFQKASFFPNPPRDLIEPDGKIHFRFAFIFELSGRNSFKVFKY
jgi:TonB family protein